MSNWSNAWACPSLTLQSEVMGVALIATPNPGLRPLCDKHRASMSPCQLKGSVSLNKAFACDTAGCTGCYDVAIGYFDLVNDRPLLEKQQQRCSDDEPRAVRLEWRFLWFMAGGVVRALDSDGSRLHPRQVRRRVFRGKAISSPKSSRSALRNDRDHDSGMMPRMVFRLYSEHAGSRAMRPRRPRSRLVGHAQIICSISATRVSE
jgi:hypothetical protein